MTNKTRMLILRSQRVLISRRTPAATRSENYLKREERLLNSFADESYRPSLKSLKALIASITTTDRKN